MLPKFLSQVPINGFEHEDGGQGLNLSYEWIEQQMKLGGKMNSDEIISQVNVGLDGIVLYVKSKESK